VQQLRGGQHGRDGACAEILAKAKEKADIIGLSGLITPSLEEMAYVAKEMQRDPYSRHQDAAADRRRHHLARAHGGQDRPTTKARWSTCRTPRVPCRWRNRCWPTSRSPVRRELNADYERIREQHASKKAAHAVAGGSRANKTGSTSPRSSPSSSAAACSRMSTWPAGQLHRLGPVLPDLGPGRPLPAILTDEVVGEAATKVFAEAQAMLKKIIDGRWLTANGVISLLPANTVNDDDIEIYTDDSRSQVAFTYYGLRQQAEKPVVDGACNPTSACRTSSRPRTRACRTTSACSPSPPAWASKNEKRFEDAHDDYSSIMLKALADRLAEAFAEYLHERVRKDLWGYAADEQLSSTDLIKEKYLGIRPAPGYPACPGTSRLTLSAPCSATRSACS
jgi:5-methyltetrahydrofolate--homocysteine methyltransferase